jgi:bifunctional ADP-heptose synthase (sugar kinase/adenylyltransferase)
VVDDIYLLTGADRRTPTYTKPMLCEPGRPARELNRLDIKNRSPLPPELEERLLAALDEAWTRVDALVVLDQVSEADCGVVTERLRRRLAEKAEAEPGKFVLADSRERIGLFRSVAIKPNERECRKALGTPPGEAPDLAAMARRAGRAVFCTCGERGIRLAEGERVREVPAYPVTGPIDIVGAGDSTSAGVVCAVAAGAGLAEAAALGNLVASITIRQLGTTGTASPEQVRRRWREVEAATSSG